MAKYINKTLVPRNFVARELRTLRGGTHQSEARRSNKSMVDSELENWRDDLEFERTLISKTDQAKSPANK